jgi:hypothetical protein
VTLDLSPGSAVILDGRQWTIQGRVPHLGQVLLADPDGKRQAVTFQFLLKHPNCYTSSRIAARGGEPGSAGGHARGPRAGQAGTGPAADGPRVGDADRVPQRQRIAEQFLLPAVTQYQLLDLLIPVRAQYAVVLARCGDFDSARSEMARLEPYRVPGDGTAELANQRRLIERIARGINS